MFRKVGEFFQSIRIANFVLLAIGLVAVFGTLPIDPFLFLKPRAVYTSWFFLSLLGFAILLVSIQIFLGLFAFASPFRKKAESPKPPSLLTKITSQEFPIPFQKIEVLQEKITSFLKSNRFHVSCLLENSMAQFVISKNGVGKWGGFLIHLGFAMAILGGFLTFRLSDIRDVMIPEGEIFTLPREQATIKLEKFTVILHSQEPKPEEYVSRLLVKDRHGNIKNHDLKVNHPVWIGWTKLFQMRYRVNVEEVELIVYQKEKPVEEVSLKPNEKKKLEKFPFVILIDQIVPDFVIGEDGKVTSRSPYFRNPAVAVSLRDESDSTLIKSQSWAFQGRFFHRGEKETEFSFVIQRLRKRYTSGIKLSCDPGAPLAYMGFLFLVIGAFISAFVIPRKLTLSIQPHLTNQTVHIEVYSDRTKDLIGLRREVDRLTKGLGMILKEAL